MSYNFNNPPGGTGGPVVRWLVGAVQFLYRRLGAGGGGGGGSQNLQQVTDIGATTTNEIVSNGGFTASQPGNDSYSYVISDILDRQSVGVYNSNIGGVELGALSGNPFIYYYLNDLTSLTITPQLLSGNKSQQWQDADGTIALIENLVADYVPYTGATTDINVNNKRITNLADPIAMQDAANKAYVDTVAASLSWKTVVRLATTAAIAGTYTAPGGPFTVTATGVISIDGVATVNGDRILIKNQGDGGVGSSFENGIYTVTNNGAGATQPVFTRAMDANTGALLVSAAVATGSEGATNLNKAYIQTTPATITLGTTAVVFNVFLNTILSPGNGIRISGNIIYNRLVEGQNGGQTVIGAVLSDGTLILQGTIAATPRLTIDPAVIINSNNTLGAASAISQVHTKVEATVNQSSAVGAGYTTLKVVTIETAIDSGTKLFLNLLGGALGTTSKFSVSNTGAVTQADGTTYGDGANIAVGSTTGTKIGTATSQKLGFFNATPVIQQTGNILTALSTLGFVASPLVADTDITFADNTTGDSSTSKHGYLKKLDNDTTHFMRGDGTWAVPNPDGSTTYTVSTDQPTTSTSLVDIPGLVTGTLSVDSVYEFEVNMMANSSTGTNGIKYGLHIGGGVAAARISALVSGADISNTVTNNSIVLVDTSSLNAVLRSSGLTGTVTMKGSFKTGATGSPTFSIQQQKVTSGTATVYAGSTLKIRKTL